ncbi:WhiB family transcriptional regulator [Streptacidiphilus sp. MAP5-52]|uniref:WhiB family transcriptional regulator n=1 Tax=Streptacidiphilus sp. MAP5-52 TaxID=3156267 RepID=UPI00351506CA
MITATTSTSTDSSAASTDWRHGAACASEDPELFFPVGEAGPALLQAEEAKAVCRRCPVMNLCLTWALETHQEHGVWGGTSEADRRSARRRAQRQAAAARTAA